jgi:hypothetical protein
VSESQNDAASDDAKKKADPRNSAAARLVQHALSAYTLGVTDTGDPYGAHREMPHIARLLRGGKTGLRAELAKWFFTENQSVASQQALADASATIEGFAAQAPSQRIYLRVAEHQNNVYIDMGDADGHVIEITEGTWDIGIRGPVLFRRTKLTGEMPKPYPDGDASLLWEFVPIAEADRPLLLAWIVQALTQPDTPHPIPALLAEQGSAKSTITRCLVDLVDPSPVPLRKAPRDADGWITAANASWVVALDNLSGEIPQWLSDSLCRAVTGDGDVRRALYTDSDVALVAFRRAPIINGIDIQVTQGDLAERLLPIDLPRVVKRRNDAELSAAWAASRPDILGGLLTLAATVHHQLPAVTMTDAPRMSDYAHVLKAVDCILGTNGLARYRERSKKVAADTLDSPFIAAMVEHATPFVDKTSGEILATLKPVAPDWKPPRDWPKNARSATGQLTRHSPALRAQGWSIDDDGGANKANRVRWTIHPPEKDEKRNSPDSPDSSHTYSSRSTGASDGELEGESAQSTALLLTRPDSPDDSPDSPDSPNTTTKIALNSHNELASQASRDFTPSRAAEPNGNDYRRPDCVCIGQPRACHWCSQAASKQAMQS